MSEKYKSDIAALEEKLSNTKKLDEVYNEIESMDCPVCQHKLTASVDINVSDSYSRGVVKIYCPNCDMFCAKEEVKSYEAYHWNHTTDSIYYLNALIARIKSFMNRKKETVPAEPLTEEVISEYVERTYGHVYDDPIYYKR